MIYIQAVIQVLISMSPHYISNVYTWVKCALWDAPYRFILDVELRKYQLTVNSTKWACSDGISNND